MTMNGIERQWTMDRIRVFRRQLFSIVSAEEDRSFPTEFAFSIDAIVLCDPLHGWITHMAKPDIIIPIS